MTTNTKIRQACTWALGHSMAFGLMGAGVYFIWAVIQNARHYSPNLFSNALPGMLTWGLVSSSIGIPIGAIRGWFFTPNASTVKSSQAPLQGTGQRITSIGMDNSHRRAKKREVALEMARYWSIRGGSFGIVIGIAATVTGQGSLGLVRNLIFGLILFAILGWGWGLTSGWLFGANTSVVLRKGARQALDILGPAEIWDFIVALNDNDEDVRKNAIEALVIIGPEAVPDLAEALKSTNTITRLGVVLALGRIAERATEAVPPLLEAEKDSNASIAHAAHAARIRIDPRRKSGEQAPESTKNGCSTS